MKLLKGILIFIITLIILALLAVGGFYAFMRFKYDVDILKASNQLNKLKTELNVEQTFPSSFKDEDLDEFLEEANKMVPDLISYSKSAGYVVSFENSGKQAEDVIRFNEKQISEFSNIYFKQEYNNKIYFGNLGETEIEFVAADISDVAKDGSGLFTAVIKISTSGIKEGITAFPVKYFKGLIPDFLYLSSTVKTVKSDNAFLYGITFEDFKINDLSSADSLTFFDMLNKFVDIGEIENICGGICELTLKLLIDGDTPHKGLAYSLRNLDGKGVNGFGFIEEEGVNYISFPVGEFVPNVPPHQHLMRRKSSEVASCTGSGNVEYWYCISCGKNYKDKDGAEELSTVEIESSGHLAEIKHDKDVHWSECVYCNEVLTEKEEHASDTYVKTKAEHYKLCSVCNEVFEKDNHQIIEDACSVCGFGVNYEEKCKSYYGYRYLAGLPNGSKYKEFYDRIDQIAVAFHDDKDADAEEITVNKNKKYVAGGELDFSTSGISQNEAISIWTVYRADHPLYYWISNNVIYTSKTISVCVIDEYRTGAARSAENSKLYLKLDEYFDAVATESSAYNVALAFHDKIISESDYALDEEGNPEDAHWAHSIVGIFDNGSAVCEGYSKAFSLLLNACGVENAYVSGKSNDVGHAWNLVNLDGKWYWYDVTWDDQPHMGSGIVYNNLCVPNGKFNDHVVSPNIDDMTKGIGYHYGLPSPSVKPYSSDGLEYGEKFTADKLEYELCGYGKVRIVSASGLEENVTLSSTVTYKDVEYTVSEIGSGAFKKQDKIVSINIPSSIAVIDYNAFGDCTALKTVDFEDKSGWYRTPTVADPESEQISDSALQNTADAARKLKQLYPLPDESGGSAYYVWVKKGT